LGQAIGELHYLQNTEGKEAVEMFLHICYRTQTTGYTGIRRVKYETLKTPETESKHKNTEYSTNSIRKDSCITTYTEKEMM
jgi:transposase